MLSRRYRVELIGFQFPRYGNRVWQPLRRERLRPAIVPGRSFPEFQQTLVELVPRIDADLVIACKARLPALQLGLMIKAARGRPLLVDVDDYELSFFANREPLPDIADVAAESLVEPHEEAWTRHVETLLPFADGLLVSNAALRARFGGTVVPHARDETRFDPGLFDRSTARRRLALGPRHRLVLFVGTPRPHKGVMQVLEAIRECGNPDYRFAVVGTPPDGAFAERLLRARGDVLRMMREQPFSKLPRLLAGADLVCLMQDPTSDISRYQLPAKVVDAVAMGVPVLATPTAPLEPLIAAGVVEAADATNLAGRIDKWLRASQAERAQHAEVARRWFLANASYEAVLPTLAEVIDAALANPRQLDPRARVFLDGQTERFTIGSGSTLRTGSPGSTPCL